METLPVKIRDKKNSKAKQIRKNGDIPAVLYGHKVKNVNLRIDAKIFDKTFKIAKQTDIISLDIEDSTSKQNVLIHDIIRDVFTQDITHVDFYQVKMDKKLKTRIPLKFDGESFAVKSDKGVLMKIIYDIEVEALPGDLPHEIIVDISTLKTFDDTITVGNLSVPHNVTIHAEENDIVAKVSPPRKESEISALEEDVTMDIGQVKVEGADNEKEEGNIDEKKDEKKEKSSDTPKNKKNTA